jgi:hypothetical protein
LSGVGGGESEDVVWLFGGRRGRWRPSRRPSEDVVGLGGDSEDVVWLFGGRGLTLIFFAVSGILSGVGKSEHVEAILGILSSEDVLAIVGILSSEDAVAILGILKDATVKKLFFI